VRVKAVLALPLVLALAGTAAAEVILRADPPRGHGWWLGDRLTHVVTLVPAPGFALDPASLPRPRAVAYWLDLADVRTEPARIGGNPGVSIVTDWRNFYAALEPTARDVPPFDVRFLGPEGAVETVTVPGWSFVTAPIRPILAPSTAAALQPDAGIAPMPAGLRARASAGFGLLALLALAGLGFNQGWWPFHHRPERPLTRAFADLRRARDPRGRAIVLHRGLDAAHGAPLLGPDLADFLARRPEFAPLRPELDAFFAGSARLFFGDGTAAADPAPLARQLAAIERGRA
jgi:mxaA protein